MKITLTIPQDRLLKSLARSSHYVAEGYGPLKALVRLGLIYRPESGFARVTALGMEIVRAVKSESEAADL